MTNAMKFDVDAALSRIHSGDIDLAPLTPAEERECSNPDCHDGFIRVEIPGYASPVAPCPECVARRARKVSHARLNAAGLAETIYDVPWSSIDLSHESWQIVHEYAQSANQLMAEKLSLIFAGDVGRGKTQAANLILHAAATAGYQVERVKWGRFVRSVRATYSKESKITENDLISALVIPDLILLDDVGAADKQSDHNERLLTAVIDERYDQGRPMILTTNLGKDELEEHLGGRAFSRLWNNADKVIFDGPNYRELRERPRMKGLASRIRERVAQADRLEESA